MNLLSGASSTQLKSPTLFDKANGEITPHFKQQLDLVGIVVKPHFPEYDSHHIVNVNEELQSNGCFQVDWDLYKKGEESAFKITYDQAVKFLDDDYSHKETQLPELTSELAEGIVCSGVYPDSLQATLTKRLNGLQLSIDENNLQYKVIYVLCKNEEIKKLSEEFINSEFKEKLDTTNFIYIVANTESNIGLTCLKKLKESYSIKNYVVITDGTSAEKDFLTAKNVLSEETCLGIASAPIKDWKADMNLYGYEKALGTQEKATIAFASSAWNFKARQVLTELSSYKVLRQN